MDFTFFPVNGGTFNTLKAFRSIMEELKNYESLNIIWTKNYSRCEIPGAIRTERYKYIFF